MHLKNSKSVPNFESFIGISYTVNSGFLCLNFSKECPSYRLNPFLVATHTNPIECKAMSVTQWLYSPCISSSTSNFICIKFCHCSGTQRKNRTPLANDFILSIMPTTFQFQFSLHPPLFASCKYSPH